MEVCREDRRADRLGAVGRRTSTDRVWAGRPFFIRIGVSQASLAPASSSAAMTAGQTRGSRSSMLVSMSSGGAVGGRGGAPTKSRSTLAWPSGSRPPAPTPIASTVIAGCGPQRVGERGQQRGAGRACTAPWRRAAGRRSDGTPRSSSATAGGGTGSVPWAPRTEPEPTATGRDRDDADVGRPSQCTKPAQTPTTSAIASSAPTSWKATSSGSVPWTAASATASRSKARSGEVADRPRRGRPRSSRARMSRQVRWCSESATSTWQRVAAKPLRVTCSTRSATGSGATASTAALQHVERDAGAEQRAEQHVAAGAGGGVDPDGHRGRPAGRGSPARPGRRTRRRRSRCRC